MKHLKQYTMIGIIFVLLTGTFAHFLYDWTGNNHIVGLFTPINESICSGTVDSCQEISYCSLPMSFS